MAAITAAVTGVAGLASSVYQGNQNRKDANKASAAQQAAAADAQQLQQDQFGQMREDLSPYRQAGAGAVPLLSEFNTNPQAQYDFLQSNPIFQASMNARDRDTVGIAAQQGRIGTGGFSQQLQENYLLSALPLLQQREQGLTNLASLGQNAATQTGVSGLQTAQNVGELGLQSANSEAARLAANSANRQQTAASVLGGLGTIAPLIGGMFTPPPSPVIGGIQNPNQFGGIA